MWRTTEGSTGRLIQLCLAYFGFYVVTGVSVKYFLNTAPGYPGMNGMEFLAYSTLGGTVICLVVAVALRWYRLESNQKPVEWMGLRFPGELLYIVPSGICTAVVIPTTTLMYSLPISVMVAMVIMRGSVIVISRTVDAIQIRQGILKKRVYREEDVAVVFALSAVAVHVLWKREGGFEFLESLAAVTILGSYISAYSLRIYIMNYFKNTRGKGVKQDNKGFFALEQIAASVTMGLAAAGVLVAARSGATLPQVTQFAAAVSDPAPLWPGAFVAGLFYGGVAFFSVFIFMFKGRTATFAGLVNRLTSLLAGTAATLISFFLFGRSFPGMADWVSMGLILVAVGFLTLAERKRAREMAAGGDAPPQPEAPAVQPALR